MMTQNCVTHTVLSKAAEKYRVSVLPTAAPHATELLHKIALSALPSALRSCLRDGGPLRSPLRKRRLAASVSPAQTHLSVLTHFQRLEVARAAARLED
jgi:glucan phosphorylase